MGSSLLPLFVAFSAVLSSTVAQSCTWKNGQEATDFKACDPSAAQSQCCLQGEACVNGGYCYGSLGVIYRGACAGGWGNDTACPQACNDAGSDGAWANLNHCPLISPPSGATSWWCGDASVVTPCDEEATNSNPTKAQIFSLPWNGMLPQGIMPWPDQDFPGCAVSPNNQYSVDRQMETATEDSGSPASCNDQGPTDATESVVADCPNGAQIGEGVAVGVLALVALAMAGWALYERKQKNRLLVGKGQQQQYHDGSKGYTSLAPQYQSPYRPPISEMDSVGNRGRRAHEMQS